MTIQNWVILTSAEHAHAQTLDDDANYMIIGRAIDNSAPGVGLNINPDATDYDPGEVVTLATKYGAPKRMVDDPDCITYAPGLAAYLLTLPWCMLENETIFAPPD